MKVPGGSSVGTVASAVLGRCRRTRTRGWVRAVAGGRAAVGRTGLVLLCKSAGASHGWACAARPCPGQNPVPTAADRDDAFKAMTAEHLDAVFVLPTCCLAPRQRTSPNWR